MQIRSIDEQVERVEANSAAGKLHTEAARSLESSRKQEVARALVSFSPVQSSLVWSHGIAGGLPAAQRNGPPHDYIAPLVGALFEPRPTQNND